MVVHLTPTYGRGNITSLTATSNLVSGGDGFLAIRGGGGLACTRLDGLMRYGDEEASYFKKKAVFMTVYVEKPIKKGSSINKHIEKSKKGG
nr:hypothetical protein [Tanacetum cinerariifolium]